MRTYTPKQRDRKRFTSREHYQRNKKRYAAQNKAYRESHRDELRIKRSLKYFANLKENKEKRRKKYWKDPEKFKARSLAYHYANRDKILIKQSGYRNLHKSELARKQLARYYRNHELNKTISRYKRALNRDEINAANGAKKSALTEVYVRGLLSKHSILPPSAFPPELVELKRTQMRIKQTIENT